MDHLSNWIEIPVHDLPRAKAFYESVLGVELVTMDFGPLRYAMFPAKNRYNAGALVQGEGYVPSSAGTLIYLDGTGRMDVMLERVPTAGGSVIMPRTFLSPEAGDVAIIADTEGNRLGFQAAADVPEDTPVSDDVMKGLLGAAAPSLVFLLRRGPDYDVPSLQHLQWEHARNMFALLRAGKLRSVTALTDGSDVLGVGILDTDSRGEAERILGDDPGVRGGRLRVELLSGISFVADEVRFG